MADREATVERDSVPTLGEIAEVLEGFKARGVTRQAVAYALARVFWEEGA